MTHANIELHQSPEAFVKMACNTELEELIQRRNELLARLNQATDIPAMEETRQQIRAARAAVGTVESRLKMAQSALWDWEHAITNRSYELTQAAGEDAA